MKNLQAAFIHMRSDIVYVFFRSFIVCWLELNFIEYIFDGICFEHRNLLPITNQDSFFKKKSFQNAFHSNIMSNNEIAKYMLDTEKKKTISIFHVVETNVNMLEEFANLIPDILR